MFFALFFSALLVAIYKEMLPPPLHFILQNDTAFCLTILCIMSCISAAQDVMTMNSHEIIYPLEPNKTYIVESTPVFLRDVECKDSVNIYVATLKENNSGEKKLYRVPFLSEKVNIPALKSGA